MTHPIVVPDEAVEAAMRAWYPKGWKPEDYEHHEPELRDAIAAALPHLLPAMTETINRVCDRADEMEARVALMEAALARIAAWDVPFEPGSVDERRAVRELARWGLETKL